MMTKDIAVSLARNTASLAACEAIYARAPNEHLDRHIQALRGLCAEMSDPANQSPGGLMWRRGGGTLRDYLDDLVEDAGRKMDCIVNRAFR